MKKAMIQHSYYTNSFKLTVFLTLVLIFFAPRTAAEEKQRLHGRVEQLFIDGKIELPVELKAKAELFSKADLTKPLRIIPPPKTLNMPSIFRGRWYGKLRVIEADYKQYFQQNFRDDYLIEDALVGKGSFGEAMFRFIDKGRGEVVLDSPSVKFPNTLNNPNLRYRYLYMLTGFLSKSGSSSTNPCTDSYTLEQLLSNKTIILTPEMAEQDTVTVVGMRHKTTNRKTRFLSEHMFLFKKVDSVTMHVKAAEIEYSLDGEVWKKILLEGDLKYSSA